MGGIRRGEDVDAVAEAVEVGAGVRADGAGGSRGGVGGIPGAGEGVGDRGNAEGIDGVALGGDAVLEHHADVLVAVDVRRAGLAEQSDGLVALVLRPAVGIDVVVAAVVGSTDVGAAAGQRALRNGRLHVLAGPVGGEGIEEGLLPRP